jgi:hypothetical protein
VVSMLAFGTQDDEFKPVRSRRIIQGEKILSMPSFGGEVKPLVPCHRFVACKRTLHLVWYSPNDGRICPLFLSYNSALHKQRSLMSFGVERLWR